MCLALGCNLVACAQNTSANQNVGESSVPAASDESAVQVVSETPETGGKDYYTDDDFSFPEGYDDEREDAQRCTVIRGVTYYSSTVGHSKECTVILPPGYSEEETYPVVYCLHGFDGSPSDWEIAIKPYENMIADGVASKAILVLPQMFTSEKSYDESTEEEKRLAYDNFAQDLEQDLMPFIQGAYPVATGRENTAIIGLSQGGTESLAIGFKLQAKIGYIASLAPCSGVIPTPYYEGTYWNWPILDDFNIYDPSTEPLYLLLNVGSEDPWDFECTLYYDQVLTEEGIRHQFYQLDGVGHGHEAWISGFYNFMKRIF